MMTCHRFIFLCNIYEIQALFQGHPIDGTLSLDQRRPRQYASSSQKISDLRQRHFSFVLC